jgi:hypothetical protein
MSSSRDDDPGKGPKGQSASGAKPPSADLEPFFSLQQFDDAPPEDPSESSLSGTDMPLLTTEEEPTIREGEPRTDEITAYHALSIDGLSEPRDPLEEPSDSSLDSSLDSPPESPPDSQALTAELPASGEDAEVWASGDEHAPAPAPPAPLVRNTGNTGGMDPPTMESWGDLEDSEGEVSPESGHEWDTMGDDAPLSDNLEDSLEWDRTQGQDTAELLSMTGISSPVDTAEVQEPSDDDRWVALSVDEDEVSGGDSISLVGGADRDLPDPEGETVVERMALGFARETSEEPVVIDPDAQDEPSIPSMIVDQGIDAFRQGDRAFALSCFEQALRGDPDDSRAQSYLELTHDLYVRDHLPDAGLHSVPQLRVGREMLMSLEIDPQAGGVLAMIDGLATVEELETMLPYFERETIYKHLADALEKGLIEFES